MWFAAALTRISAKTLFRASIANSFHVSPKRHILVHRSLSFIFICVSYSAIMKDHTSHDILLLCPPCHQRSNISDTQMRYRLANMADAPFTAKEGGARLVEQPNLRYCLFFYHHQRTSNNYLYTLRRLKSAAKALHFNATGIPPERVEALRLEIRSHFPADTEINDQLIQEMSEIETW